MRERTGLGGDGNPDMPSVLWRFGAADKVPSKYALSRSTNSRKEHVDKVYIHETTIKHPS